MWARRLRPALALLLLLSCELFLPLLQNLVAHAVLHGPSNRLLNCDPWTRRLKICQVWFDCATIQNCSPWRLSATKSQAVLNSSAIPIVVKMSPFPPPMRCVVALVLAAAAPTLGGQLNVFTGRTRGVPPPMVQLGRGGKLDITTGQATLDTLTPPPSLCTTGQSNGWEFLMQDGSTFFSSFYTNATQFFVAREQCPADAKKAHVAVLQSYISYGIMGLKGVAPNDKVKDYQLRRLALLDPVLNCPDSEMNCTETDAIAHMMWDGTCNLILSVHGGNATHSVLTRHEVSEYDGQIRPEPPVVYERALPGSRASRPATIGATISTSGARFVKCTRAPNPRRTSVRESSTAPSASSICSKIGRTLRRTPGRRHRYSARDSARYSARDSASSVAAAWPVTSSRT